MRVSTTGNGALSVGHWSPVAIRMPLRCQLVLAVEMTCQWPSTIPRVDLIVCVNGTALHVLACGGSAEAAIPLARATLRPPRGHAAAAGAEPRGCAAERKDSICMHAEGDTSARKRVRLSKPSVSSRHHSIARRRGFGATAGCGRGRSTSRSDSCHHRRGPSVRRDMLEVRACMDGTLVTLPGFPQIMATAQCPASC